MSTILYHKGVLIVDSGFVITPAEGVNMFTNDKSKCKLTLSKDKVLAIAYTGSFINRNDFQSIANFLECVLKRDGVISFYDKIIKDVLCQIGANNCSELCFLVMEKIGNSAYHIEMRDSENGLTFNMSRLSYDDVFGIGTGSLIGIGAIGSGMDIFKAAEFAVKNDSVSRFPLHYVKMEDLQVAEETPDDEATYLTFINNTLKEKK